MQRVRFSCEYAEGGHVITTHVTETTHENVDAVVDVFRQFLLAMGYHPDTVKDALGPDS